MKLKRWIKKILNRRRKPHPRSKEFTNFAEHQIDPKNFFPDVF